jgi:nucleoside-diphosphate-sugar epimerase
MLDAMYRSENNMGFAKLHFPVADVRDVAEAHAALGENTAAKDRFIIAGDRNWSLLEMVNALYAIGRRTVLLTRLYLLRLTSSEVASSTEPLRTAL